MIATLYRHHEVWEICVDIVLLYLIDLIVDENRGLSCMSILSKTLIMVILRRAESSSTRVVEAPQTRCHVALLWLKRPCFLSQVCPINFPRLLAPSSLGWRLEMCYSTIRRGNLTLALKASDIDKYSRVVFPIMFLTFHLMYWMIYLRYCMTNIKITISFKFIYAILLWHQHRWRSTRGNCLSATLRRIDPRRIYWPSLDMIKYR